MTIKEIAKIIGKTEQTLHNWKKNNPKLYEAIINYFNDTNNYSLTKEEKELIESFRKLDKEEQDLYYHEIKARALRKKLK